MTNRHPLLSQGAGQAERLLPDEVVVPYCDQLAQRLGWLALVVEAEQRNGRISIAAAKAAQAFLRELQATVMVLALKHGRQLMQIEPVPLTIDPTESGMPTFKDFWMLYDDCVHAQERLDAIPMPDELLAQAVETIYRGERPVKQQILWLERAYLARLAATPVIADFRIHPAVRLDDGSADRLYAVTWTGVVHSVNLLECTTLHFTERRGWHVSGGIGQLNNLIQSIAGGRHSLQEMIGLCNEAAWIVPQTIERVTIGPYYHRWTENDSYVQRVFAAANDPDAWMLRCSIERAATTRAAERSLMDSLFGREPMEAGPSVRSSALLAPLAIKQFLGNVDEEGLPAAVYGVSRAGDLVG